MKTCIECNVEKYISDFRKNKANKEGLHNKCKSCMDNYNKKWKTINKDKNKIYMGNYHIINKEYISEYDKNWILNNSDYKKEYYLENKPKLIKYSINYKKERLKIDPLFKLKYTLIKRINTYIKKKKYNKTEKINDLLGTTYNLVKQHLESQFTEGMSWENHGIKGWHIDHIIPLASAKTKEEAIKLFHYTNLQPLWWYENLKKSSKLNYK